MVGKEGGIVRIKVAILATTLSGPAMWHIVWVSQKPGRKNPEGCPKKWSSNRFQGQNLIQLPSKISTFQRVHHLVGHFARHFTQEPLELRAL